MPEVVGGSLLSGEDAAELLLTPELVAKLLVEVDKVLFPEQQPVREWDFAI